VRSALLCLAVLAACSRSLPSGVTPDGDHVVVRGVTYAIDDGQRPGCWSHGLHRTFYPHIYLADLPQPGKEVSC
jgi:hypothetical protein